MLDDLGYGDVTCYNPDSKIPTPYIDSLAAEGMRFTDAHTPGSVCVPSRFGFLTGRYPLEKRGYTPKGKQGGVIKKGIPTLASVLRDQGYETAMVGKWHNGFWNWIDKKPAVPDVIEGGPHGCGFDSFYGIPHSLDIQPYLYIRDNKAVAMPTEDVEANDSIAEGWSRIQGKFWRKGKMSPGFKHEEVLSQFTDESIAYLENRNPQSEKPYFLYISMAGPHTPWLPSAEFDGKSGIGLYGDFLMEIDDCIGKILQALEKTGQAEDTLVCLSSDNGPVWLPADEEKYSHSGSAELRGMKGDVFEAGHRVPFIAKWPAKIKKGSTSSETVCLTDLMSTFAAAAEFELSSDAGLDSVNLLPLMTGTGSVNRETTLHVGWKEKGLRKGDYKYIDTPTSGGFTEVEVTADAPPGQLYNLADDIGETKNLYNAMPEKVEELKAVYEDIVK
jgi:arylsulfatase A-like enzyme